MRALIIAVLITAMECAAQQTATTSATPESQTLQATPSPDKTMITIQPDTRILLEFRRSISTRTAKSGDGVYFQTSFPIVVNNKVTIPAGTYVQGTLDHVNHHGRNGIPELVVKMATMTFPSGYSVGIPGTIDIVTSVEYCRYERAEIAPGALAVGIGAPIAGTLIGAFAGNHGRQSQTINGVPEPAFNPPFNIKGEMIGMGAGMAVGFTTLFTNLGKNVFIDVGAPTEMILEQPVQLDENRLIYGALQRGPAASANDAQLAAKQDDTGTTACEMQNGSSASATIVSDGDAAAGAPSHC